MNNVTKMAIAKPANEVFEAFVDPEKIGNFWFSSSSERWTPGKTIQLRYDEYNADGEIRVKDIVKDEKITFEWDYGHVHLVTITFTAKDEMNTIIEVNEDGFSDDKESIPLLVGNKEGWVYTLTCLKAYLEHGITTLRAALVH
ncbi:SRPBCC family protein [Paenibacillus chondroitinus]|uniref:SRPBCC family protein n=1 Tax=Paenibacillus chondroitinus TaxID=59842 RepID=A0ABU6DK28_9BACL|nr:MULTISPECIES: SRPBCC family protein [Paenibacillus]MCY9660696.1 SRPBCC family protein [Paenibacillus anseongense]MEB4798124.1 SRPBCC family protein [Paenibacillus chondroitinus]